MLRSNSSYVINPDAFSVNPMLVGLPLARPSRRLVAMLVDLALVSILVHLGGPVLLALAAAYAAFRFAGRMSQTGGFKKLALQGAGALVLFVMAVSAWNGIRARARGFMDDAVEASVSTPGGDKRVNGMRVGMLAPQLIRLSDSHDQDEARKIAPELVKGLRQAGLSDDDTRETMLSLVDDSDEPWMERVIQDALGPVSAPARDSADAANPAALSTDSLASRYAAALAASDTGAAKTIAPLLGARLAQDSLTDLHRKVSALTGEVKAAKAEAEASKSEGIVGRLLGFLDELGIGFGWTGLYFTAFVGLWKGQTPGKRLLGIRVLRLNGQPMTFWMAFERFGGYAAGLVTGLLGFAQVYWDHNRQMIHDKIVETVVVRERAA